MVGFSRVSRVRVSRVRVRVRIRVSVRIRVRVRLSFSGANLNRKTLGGELLLERPGVYCHRASPVQKYTLARVKIPGTNWKQWCNAFKCCHAKRR